MNPSLLLITILFPIVFSVFIPLIPFKKRAHMEIYIEVIVIATSVMAFLLLINRPGELVLIEFARKVSFALKVDGMSISRRPSGLRKTR